MKFLTFILFALLGAALSFLPINFGDLRVGEIYIAATLLAAVGSFGAVLGYNFVTGAQMGGAITGIATLPNVIAGVVGALIMVALFNFL